MSKFFSLPVFVGIIAGLVFPFAGLSLIWITSSVLFLLLFFNVLGLEPRLLLSAIRRNAVGFSLIHVLLFLFFPVLQTAVATFLIADRDYVFGIAMASLAPAALVLPVFLRKNGGDIELGAAIVIVSTLLCPLIILPMLRLLGLTEPFLNASSLLPYFGLFAGVPVVLALAISAIFPQLKSRLVAFAPPVSAILLGVLMFVLVGSAFNRVPLRSWQHGDLPALIGLMIWMDFGVYFVVKKAWNETAALSLATRNFAVPGSLLLFFQPKAALPAAIGLVVHAVYFQWLMIKKPAS